MNAQPVHHARTGYGVASCGVSLLSLVRTCFTNRWKDTTCRGCLASRSTH